MAADLDNPAFWSSYSDYQRVAHEFTSLYARKAWALADIPEGARVLDIATGTGALAIEAARAGASVLATDFSPGMIEAVRSHGLPGLDAAIMDGQALDLPDASFDAAFSMFGIMLFPDWRAGLAEMARVLKPGGIGCVGTWKEITGAAGNLLLQRLASALFPEVEPSVTLEGMAEWRDPDRLAASLGLVGFESVEVTEVTADFIVDDAAIADPDRLFQFSMLWRDIDERRRDLLVDVIRNAISLRDGALHVPSPALIAIGRRR